MLFTYKYVPHAMEKMQTFIDFIFYDVWCKALGNGEFRFELFDTNPELKALMETFYYSDTQGGDFFYSHVEKIYGLFAVLTPPQIDQLKQWYQGNNDIEKVCANDPITHLARYADISALNTDLSEQLAAFFKGLYDKIDLAALRKRIGSIDDHYQAFMEKNTVGKCPFCGISDMLGVNHTPREAYDHYLPRKLYPFNSINFHNLVPACHHCNSSYKTSKDPAFTPKDKAGAIHRRKAFYPYSTQDYSIEIIIDLKNPAIDRLVPADVQLTFGPSDILEEIETWKDVYGIEERYKNKCCSGDAKNWLEEIRILHDTYGIDPLKSLAMVKQLAAKDPVANSNFLQLAFLEGCQRIGLLS